MNTKNFTVTLTTNEFPEEVFNNIKNVRGWWSGLYGEEFEGSSDKLNDEFTFKAGGGMHYSKQKLVELIPNKKIVWLVTDSKLSFIKDENEWTDTKISFEIFREDNQTKIVFTHIGLVLEIECYDNCSSAWSQYLQQFLVKLVDNSKAKSNNKEAITKEKI